MRTTTRRPDRKPTHRRRDLADTAAVASRRYGWQYGGASESQNALESQPPETDVGRRVAKLRLSFGLHGSEAANQKREAGVADEQSLRQLFSELERVGVDPHTLSAGLGVRSDEALRVLRGLPDNAGPAAFLSRLRQDATQRGPAHR